MRIFVDATPSVKPQAGPLTEAARQHLRHFLESEPVPELAPHERLAALLVAHLETTVAMCEVLEDVTACECVDEDDECLACSLRFDAEGMRYTLEIYASLLDSLLRYPCRAVIQQARHQHNDLWAALTADNPIVAAG